MRNSLVSLCAAFLILPQTSMAAPYLATVSTTPATLAIVRDMTGDYSQHPLAARAMYAAIDATCTRRGVDFGEYPQDPDAVGPDRVHWRFGLLLDGRTLNSCKASIKPPYHKQFYPQEQVVFVQATLATSKDAGLYILKWLPTSGYVQVAPTRMIFLDKRATPDSPVRIETPVRKRTWARPKTGL